LEQSLKTLRLSGLAASLDIRLTEARGNHLEHEEFLELVSFVPDSGRVESTAQWMPKELSHVGAGAEG
jgi:hypothetical protein